MEVTVAIICSKDELISKCLRSIPGDTKILAVLNNPSDSVLRIVSDDNRVSVLRHDELNLGYLRQLAAEEVKTPGIIYIDSDCEFEESTVDIVSSELETYAAVSIPMRYRAINIQTVIVAKCREFTTPDDALFMPAAFSLDVQNSIGGFLYDRKLSWGEDSDQRKRLHDNNVQFCISKGKIWHKPLDFRSDASSARRLGQGRYLQELNGYVLPRRLSKDICLIKDIKLSVKCAIKAGFLAALYHLFIWRPAYKFGYWKEVLKHGH
jgi:glycosyltransferase involved in cell wall biosynthesis